MGNALADVDDRYDVVIVDRPPQLGYLTLTALTAATSVLITVHPQMLDLMSMSQFLLMLGNITKTIKKVGANVRMDWLRYLITRDEPTDIPRGPNAGVHAVDAGRGDIEESDGQIDSYSGRRFDQADSRRSGACEFQPGQNDWAIECMDAVNFEVQGLIHQAWGKVRTLTAVKISKNDIVFNSINRQDARDGS